MSIIVLGDLMLDKFSYGRVQRLNPESPASLVNIEKEEYRLGGAANVASNISSLNGEVNLIGVIGKDLNGEIFTNLCEKLNIKLNVIKLDISTITKQRFVETTYHQQLLRADYEQFISLSQDNKLNLINLIKQASPKFIVISDYIKGTIDKYLIKLIVDYCLLNNVKLLVDTKPKNIDLFYNSYLIKPNMKEFKEIIGENIPNEDQYIEKYGLQIVKKYNSNFVITRSEKGASLITSDLNIYHFPSQAKQIFDVTGAGDTFLATIVFCLSKGYSLTESVKYGNIASGIVVGKVGTEVINLSELKI